MFYCKNCGQTLEDSAHFCTACGTAVERPAQPSPGATAPAAAVTPAPQGYPYTPPVAPPAPPSLAAPVPVKKKKTGIVLLCIGVLVVIAVGAVLLGVWGLKKSTSFQLGNTPANLYCGGITAEHEGTVYFSYANGTYVRKNSQTQKIFDRPLAYINIHSDGSLYGITLLSEESGEIAVVHIDSNGDFLQTLYTFDENTTHMFLALYGDDLFIQSESALLKLNIPSNEITTLEDRLNQNGIASVSIDEKGLYYMKGEGEAKALYHLPFGETTPVKCNATAAMYFDSGFDFYPPVADGQVYMLDDRELKVNAIHALTGLLSTYHLETIGEEVSGTTEDIPLWCSGSEMYCIMNLTDDSGQALCQVTLSENGTGDLRVLATGDFYGYWINVVGNQVYCISMDSESKVPVYVYDTQTENLVPLDLP